MATRIEVRAGRDQPLGMPATRFLRDYWQKQPLLIRAAFAHLRNPVAPDDLAGLACAELALARIVLHAPEHDRWTLRNGPFAETDFAMLPESHWTLLVQDVDKWDADVAALLRPFDFLPTWRIDDVMVSYAEDGGSVGAHVDQYDVFLLQGLGRRRWQISIDPNAPKAFRADADLKLLRQFAPTHEWLLEPGDMLYLPPGVPHHGVAVGACMTYSIGMRAPSQAELLIDFAETLAERIPETARLADPDLLPARADGEIDDAAIARVVAAMPWLHPSAATRKKPGQKASRAANESGCSDLIDSSWLRTWFGCFITRYRSAHAVAPNPRPLTDVAFSRAIEQGRHAQRNPWSRFAWTREARDARLFAAGESHLCSPSLAKLVCANANFALAKASMTPRDQDVLRALIDAGHLALTRARRLRKSM